MTEILVLREFEVLYLLNEEDKKSTEEHREQIETNCANVLIFICFLGHYSV